MAGAKAAAEADAVTNGAVRCIAWLGVADVLVPAIGLGCCFDNSVAFDKERLHVAREEKKVGDATKYAEWRLKAEHVAHRGAAA